MKPFTRKASVLWMGTRQSGKGAMSTPSSVLKKAPYASGERTAAVKVKQIRSADCVVGGFRYASGAKVLGSLLLGLYGDDGLLH